MNPESYGVASFWAVVAIISGVLIFVIPDREPTLVTRIDQKQVATAGSYAWPEGAIIHKQYGNSWYCVEIDGHYLIVRSRGQDSIAASVSSCED